MGKEWKISEIVAITIILAIILILAVSWIIVPRCVHATIENGRFDVSCYLDPPEGCGTINMQDSGLIFINSFENMDPYVYDVRYDMNCDNIVNNTDVVLCDENWD